jgi:NAD(P)-dependent dehydrogenase (short-subunit alcohol dehydrogenase family)
VSGLRGKVVLVTGGGRGLGAAIVRALAFEGATVVVADLYIERAQKVVDGLLKADLDAHALELDVTREDQVSNAITRVLESCGRLDALVNNAGIDVTVPIKELDSARWDAVIRTNLYGPFLLSRRVLPHLEQYGGHIVNIASTAAKRAWPNAAAYHASKWGLLGLSHALHAELRPRGVKVTAIVAGGMRTPFLLDRFPDIDPGVLQDPEDVARAVVFALTAPPNSVIAEMTVLPMRETSWP